MARDPLRSLLALRQREVDQARSAMAACLRAEAEALDRVQALDEAARRDCEVSRTWHDAQQFREMAAIRLGVLQTRRGSAAAEAASAASRVAEARDGVTAARTAAEAVEQLIGKRQAAHKAAAEAREQHTLDDITRTRLVVRQRDAAS